MEHELLNDKTGCYVNRFFLQCIHSIILTKAQNEKNIEKEEIFVAYNN